MKNPAMLLPDAVQAIQAVNAATHQGGVPSETLGLVHLRASQINGCSVCIDSGSRHAKQAGKIRRAPVRSGGLAGGTLLHRC
jgi:AhpD family alkylhydroperoxidase